MPTVRIVPTSIERGQAVELELAGFADAHGEVGWYLDRVDDELTEFSMASVGLPTASSGVLVLKCPTTKDLIPGLYILSRLDLHDAGGQVLRTLTPAQYGVVPFEVREPGTPRRPVDDLRTALNHIGLKRDAEFTAGLGAGAACYQVFVFLKDCLLTQRMRLGRYEVIPGPGLSSLNELEAVQSFLRASGTKSLGGPDNLIAQARMGQPVAVVHFPVVRADSVEDAGMLAEQETGLLISLLSVQRGGPGSLFCSLVVEPTSGQMHYRFHVPHYGGNMMGGWLAGEEPRVIVARLRALHKSPLCTLYVDFYREALSERNVEFQYFRLWSLLEIVARHKGYLHKPKRDWSGVVVTNARGKGRTIQDDAQDLVFELLRETMAPEISEAGFASNLKQGLISELIAIWYRRRNCVAHGGACLCRDPGSGLTGVAKYANCKTAREEIAGSFDGYLLALQEVTKLVLAAELAAAGVQGSASSDRDA